jgi:hypothetical protein
MKKGAENGFMPKSLQGNGTPVAQFLAGWFYCFL